jgi:hypothetical protein
VPVTVNDGFTDVTVRGVVVSVFGDRTNADGTLPITREKLLVKVPFEREPVIVVPVAASPHKPDPEELTHWV